MGARGSASQPSSLEYTGVEVAAVLEASAIVRSDWVVSKAVWRRCVHDLTAFCAVVWPLALVG